MKRSTIRGRLALILIALPLLSAFVYVAGCKSSDAALFNQAVEQINKNRNQAVRELDKAQTELHSWTLAPDITSATRALAAAKEASDKAISAEKRQVKLLESTQELSLGKEERAYVREVTGAYKEHLGALRGLRSRVGALHAIYVSLEAVFLADQTSEKTALGTLEGSGQLTVDQIKQSAGQFETLRSKLGTAAESLLEEGARELIPELDQAVEVRLRLNDRMISAAQAGDGSLIQRLVLGEESIKAADLAEKAEERSQQETEALVSALDAAAQGFARADEGFGRASALYQKLRGD